jgi:hypothetical protein
VRAVLPYLLLTGLSLPFVGKPVHIDDANFVAMARHVRVDPGQPLDFLINWQGSTERAFDVLSNPPGIAYWLAPVADGPTWLMHLWMLPWLWLAVWGALRLGGTIAGRREEAALLMLGAPAALLATQALTPDLPLLACGLAGMAGILQPVSRGGSDRRWCFAALVGLGAVFRYSGAVLIPVVVLWLWLQRDRRGAVRLGAIAAAPLVLLMATDWIAYGQVHLVAMMGFQGAAAGGLDTLHKLGASVAMLGGAVVLPVICWTNPKRALTGLMVGAGLGCTVVAFFALSGLIAGWTVVMIAAGGAVLGGCTTTRDDTDRLLLVWLGLGLLFLLGLRFSATRYWLPFMAPAVLIPLRTASQRSCRIAVVLTPLLALALAADDLEFASAQKHLAEQVHAAADRPGRIAGHWGFQHHLERAGWTPLEDDAPLPPGTVVATSAAAWPQKSSACTEPVQVWVAADRWPGPRVHTSAGGANIHGFALAGDPPQPTFVPWGFGNDPLDTVRLDQACLSRPTR